VNWCDIDVIFVYVYKTYLTGNSELCGDIKIRQKNGGSERDRTADLLRAKQALSHLSYGPTYVERFGLYTPTKN
jgi:hypothetical protein